MTVDSARKLTDKKLGEIERRIESIYAERQKGISAKWNAYLTEQNKKIDSLQQLYDDAKKSGDKEKIKQYGKRLGQEKRMLTIYNEKYKEMVDDTTLRIAEANQIALNYVNGELPGIYSINYNQSKSIADQMDMRFSIVNEDVVKNMISSGDIILPQMEKALKIPKDQRWNTKQINSSILQGILQGESMEDISKRLLPIVHNNEVAAIRTARTSVTGAENKGRLDSYKRLEEDGAVLKKVWIATGDGRTRDWHLEMDGQEVDPDDVFIDGNGNELEYPGDPSAAPETVYNCRCSMKTHIIGFRKKDGRIEKIEDDGEKTQSRHEKEIEKEKKARQDGRKNN